MTLPSALHFPGHFITPHPQVQGAALWPKGGWWVLRSNVTGSQSRTQYQIPARYSPGKILLRGPILRHNFSLKQRNVETWDLGNKILSSLFCQKHLAKCPKGMERPQIMKLLGHSWPLTFHPFSSSLPTLSTEGVIQSHAQKGCPGPLNSLSQETILSVQRKVLLWTFALLFASNHPSRNFTQNFL